jgi:hypothetical protein
LLSTQGQKKEHKNERKVDLLAVLADRGRRGGGAGANSEENAMTTVYLSSLGCGSKVSHRFPEPAVSVLR